MLLVLPVSLSDRDLLPVMEKAFGVYPPGSGHKLLVVGSPNASSMVNQTAQNLSKYFSGHSDTYIFDMDFPMGWPMGPNYYFQQTAWYMPSKYHEPWLWFEPDTTPTRAGWLDEINKPVVELTFRTLENNGRVPRYFGVLEPACLEHQGGLMPEAGDQMAAVGVYDSNMEDVLSLRALSATNIVWNTFLRWYITPFFAPLPMIQNNWKTAHYRVEEDQIVCDSVARWAWDVHFNKPIRDDAAIVHGCKDGTLLEVLIGRGKGVEVEPPEIKPADVGEPAQPERRKLVRVKE